MGQHGVVERLFECGQAGLARALRQQGCIADRTKEILSAGCPLEPSCKCRVGPGKRREQRALTLEPNAETVHVLHGMRIPQPLQVPAQSTLATRQPRCQMASVGRAGEAASHTLQEAIGAQVVEQPFHDGIEMPLKSRFDIGSGALRPQLEPLAQALGLVTSLIGEMIVLCLQPGALHVGIAHGVGGLTQRTERTCGAAIDGAVQHAVVLAQGRAQPAERDPALVQDSGGRGLECRLVVGRIAFVAHDGPGQCLPVPPGIRELMQPMQGEQASTFLCRLDQRTWEQPTHVGG